MNDENRMITIDGKEYNFEELEDNQKAMVNHVASLNNKIAQARFDLDQLTVAAGRFQQNAGSFCKRNPRGAARGRVR